jgi:hypothetical protein
MATSISICKKSKNSPDVITFAYIDYKVNEGKRTWTAKCKTCRAVISEKAGTTSAFVRHLSVTAHEHLREQ